MCTYWADYISIQCFRMGITALKMDRFIPLVMLLLLMTDNKFY